MKRFTGPRAWTASGSRLSYLPPWPEKKPYLPLRMIAPRVPPTPGTKVPRPATDGNFVIVDRQKVPICVPQLTDTGVPAAAHSGAYACGL